MSTSFLSEVFDTAGGVRKSRHPEIRIAGRLPIIFLALGEWRGEVLRPQSPKSDERH
jgi:hypothetical protein